MGDTIRARVKGGVLEPLEKMDLPEGKEVLLSIVGVPAHGRNAVSDPSRAGCVPC